MQCCQVLQKMKFYVALVNLSNARKCIGKRTLKNPTKINYTYLGYNEIYSILIRHAE